MSKDKKNSIPDFEGVPRPPKTPNPNPDPCPDPCIDPRLVAKWPAGVFEDKPAAVNHPSHYQSDKGHMEVIDIIENFNLGFSLGNTVKYVLRAGHKGDEIKRIEDLKKARWYLDREIKNAESSYHTFETAIFGNKCGPTTPRDS